MAERCSDSGLILPPEDIPYRIADERIEVDPLERTVMLDGKLTENITDFQFTLLAYLASKPDCTVSRSDLSADLWQTEVNDKTWATARQQIFKLRHKLGPELGDRETGAIRARWGLGYYAVSSLTGDAIPSNEDESFAYWVADDRIAVQPFNTAVKQDGKLLSAVTKTEFKVLLALARHLDETMELPKLVMDVWDYDDAETRLSARQYIFRLRRKFGPELGHAKTGAIRTDYGNGYHAVSSLAGSQE